MPDGQVVALYCRISKAKGGRTDSVEDQEAWGREYAASAWPGLPVRVYVDNDITAADEGVTRKAFEELRADVEAGEVAHLWAVEQTRFERVEARWFRFAAELDAAGITEVHTRRDGIVRLDDDVAGIKAVLAAGEIRRLRRRIKDTLAARAAQGSPPGGSHFGYRHATTDDGRKTFVIEPGEAETVRWVADAVLSGWGLANIARDLRDRGVPTRRGGRWNEATVRQMVTKPSVAGLRSHHGDVVAGNWEPILSEEKWRLVCHTLATRTRAVGQDGQAWPIGRHARGVSRRRYLLTGGLTVCGLCGHALVAMVRTPHGKDKGRTKKAYYLCPPPLRGGCARIGVVAEPFEAEVVRRLLAHLRRPEFLEALAADEGAARREEAAEALAALDVQRAELGRMWARRELDVVGWQAARADLDAQQRHLLGELAALTPPPGVIDPASIEEDWAEMTLDEKRQVVDLFVGRVVVHPARRGVPRFDPLRVEVRGVDGEAWPATPGRG